MLVHRIYKEPQKLNTKDNNQSKERLWNLMEISQKNKYKLLL